MLGYCEGCETDGMEILWISDARQYLCRDCFEFWQQEAEDPVPFDPDEYTREMAEA